MSDFTFVALVFAGVLGLLFVVAIASHSSKERQKRQMEFVANYQFSELMKADLKRKHPEWTEEMCALAWNGFREFCMAKIVSHTLFEKSSQSLGMPSHVADEAWHTFMTHPKSYQAFCEKAFGELLNHTPDIAAKPKKMDALESVSRPTRVTFASIQELYKTHEEKVLQGRRQDGLLPSSFSGPSDLLAMSVPLLFALDAYAKSVNAIAQTDAWVYTPELMLTLATLPLDDVLMKKQAENSSGSGCGSMFSCGGPSSCGCGSSCSGGSCGGD